MRLMHFKPNTALSAAMQLFNELIGSEKFLISKESAESIILSLSVMAPHMSSELLEQLFGKQLRDCMWPQYDEKHTQKSSIMIAVQVNGKLRAQLTVDVSAAQEDIIAEAKIAVQKWFDGKEIKKTVEEYLSVKNNDGCWGTGTNFRGPLKASDEPFPDILDFKKYKDYPLNKTQSKKINKFYEKKEFDLMWNFIDSLKLDLPRGEKKEIVFGSFVGDGRRVHVPNDRVIIRVHKPIKEKQ